MAAGRTKGKVANTGWIELRELWQLWVKSWLGGRNPIVIVTESAFNQIWVYEFPNMGRINWSNECQRVHSEGGPNCERTHSKLYLSAAAHVRATWWLRFGFGAGYRYREGCIANQEESHPMTGIDGRWWALDMLLSSVNRRDSGKTKGDWERQTGLAGKSWGLAIKGWTTFIKVWPASMRN